MRISSKSILSPGRAGVRDPPNSLSTSLSRRLRNSGSVKGGASPAMFPTAAKKRGSFENPEPSSPKVTCIGQVRVRGKKKNQAKKLRTLSRRHSAGEVSFKKLGHSHDGFSSKGGNHRESFNLGPHGAQNHRQNPNLECSPVQRSWVHFPVTICEALRAFGSEFSCLIPCKTERGKEEKMAAGNGNNEGSCGAVFTRWLVAVQDGDGGGEKDIELVVGDEEEEEDEEESVWKPRRHVFEDLEIIDGRIEGHEDEARVSICVPPKNALLLMRCRSEPIKNEDLTNRSWEPTVARNEEQDEDFFEVEQQEVMDLDQDEENVQQDEANQDQELDDVQQDEANQDQELDNNVQKDEVGQDQELDNVQKDEVGQDEELDNVQKIEVGQDEELDNVQKEQKDYVGQDQELDNVEIYEVGEDQEHENVQQDEFGQDQEHENVEKEEVGQNQELDNVQKDEVGQDQEQDQTEGEEESFYLVSLFQETMDQDLKIQEHDEGHEQGTTMVTEFAEISETHEEEEKTVNEAEEHNNGVLERGFEVKEERESEKELPECLLMMMHEPKLSIMVSKETWVCSADFKRPSTKRKPPPPLPPVKSTGGNESSVADGGFPTVLQQPARSSCSFPVAPSMATVLEQKLADAVGYEPFVLTRCKSEPMKTAASKLLPESCVWENRKVERLSRVAFGVGAAGLGF
ncbi:hypothetical protein SSX86_002283 [Deinandra increscens subsp. villosa]|uniref:Uncharacterized protein n=1 Tax=Deinandra increscens subsp. villosa TaxID=3103831 RepID=A0AAP0HAW8_9ASTR